MEDPNNTSQQPPLPSTMLSSRFSIRNKIDLSHLAIPSPTATQVLLQISWCGICGTDLHEFCAGPLVAPRPENPHPITKESIPITLGHEFTGTVVRTSKEGRLTLGDKVIVDPRINCGGKCWACKQGVSNLCDSWGFVGLSGGGGGFAEFCAVEEKMCHLLPQEMKMDEATLIEPLAVARHALTVSGFERFENLDVLVVGGGPIGLAVLWNLKAVKHGGEGKGRVVVSEPAEGRRRLCERLADVVVDPRVGEVGSGSGNGSVGEVCRSKTGGKGIDVVFDCAGIPAGLRDGMDALRVKGKWVNVAGWEVPLEIPLHFAMMKELDIQFSMAYDEKDFRAVVEDFVTGKFAGVERMITGRIGLGELVERGFEELVRNREGHVKILVTPREGNLRM